MICRLSAVFCVEKMADCVFGAGARKDGGKVEEFTEKRSSFYQKTAVLFYNIYTVT